jgi:glycosyl transferase family 25
VSQQYRTYLINLDEDKDRLEFVGKQLRDLYIDFERIAAVRGTAMPGWVKPFLLRLDGSIASDLKPGEIGCYSSHLCVLQRILDSGVPGLVLEDDIEISRDLPTIMEHMQNLPTGWDIIRLSSPSKRALFPVTVLPNGSAVVKYARVPPSTGAYLITPEGAWKFLKYRGRRYDAVDQDLRKVWQNGLVTYGI